MPPALWTDDFLTGMRAFGDEPADTLVAALFKQGEVQQVNDFMRTLVGNDDLPASLPAPLVAFLASSSQLPEWADPDAIERAEDVFSDHGLLSLASLDLRQSARVLHPGDRRQDPAPDQSTLQTSEPPPASDSVHGARRHVPRRSHPNRQGHSPDTESASDSCRHQAPDTPRTSATAAGRRRVRDRRQRGGGRAAPRLAGAARRLSDQSGRHGVHPAHVRLRHPEGPRHHGGAAHQQAAGGFSSHLERRGPRDGGYATT